MERQSISRVGRGEGSMLRELKRTRASCKEGGATMAALSLFHHMDRSHGIIMTQTWGVDVGVVGMEMYVVYFP